MLPYGVQGEACAMHVQAHLGTCKWAHVNVSGSVCATVPASASALYAALCALQVSCSANSSLRHKVEDREQQLAALSNSLTVQHADLARFAESVGSCLAAARDDAAAGAAAAAAAAPSSYLSTLLAPAGAGAAAAAAAGNGSSSSGLGSMQLPGAPAGIAAGMMATTAAPARRQTWAAWVSAVACCGCTFPSWMCVAA
jgi:hypothetical protein